MEVAGGMKHAAALHDGVARDVARAEHIEMQRKYVGTSVPAKPTPQHKIKKKYIDLYNEIYEHDK